MKPIEDVFDEQVPLWQRLHGFAGAAIGEKDGRKCIKVYANSDSEEFRDAVPEVVDGYDVVFQVTGPFRKL